MHHCKLLVTKMYTSVLQKRLANSRLQTVGDKPVEEVRRDLRDRKFRTKLRQVPKLLRGPDYNCSSYYTLRDSCLDLCN